MTETTDQVVERLATRIIFYLDEEIDALAAVGATEIDECIKPEIARVLREALRIGREQAAQAIRECDFFRICMAEE